MVNWLILNVYFSILHIFIYVSIWFVSSYLNPDSVTLIEIDTNVVKMRARSLVVPCSCFQWLLSTMSLFQSLRALTSKHRRHQLSLWHAEALLIINLHLYRDECLWFSNYRRIFSVTTKKSFKDDLLPMKLWSLFAGSKYISFFKFRVLKKHTETYFLNIQKNFFK